MKILYSTWLVMASVALSIGGSQANGAQWGSLRGNNHSATESSRAEIGRLPSATAPPREVRQAPRVEQRQILSPTGHRDERERNEREVRNSIERNRSIERHVEHHSVPPPVVRDWERERHDHFRMDVAAERRHAYRWYHYRPGMFVNVLPTGFMPIYVGPSLFYYDSGVFYTPQATGYVVAPPPLGAIVPELPPGAEMIVTVDGRTYYYAGGVFYAQVPNGFQVVTAPLGVTVALLPPEASQVSINGRVYYQAFGVYYLPVIQDGVTVYVTVQP
jgi:hypothetical protein